MDYPPMFMPAVRDQSMTWMQFMGIPIDGTDAYRGLADFARAPADEAWVYACIRRLYSSAQRVPLRVYARQGADLVPWRDAIPSDGRARDLERLIEWVNPVDMTGHDLVAYLVASVAAWGETFIQKVPGRLGGPPQELYWLAAPAMTPFPLMGRAVETWRYQPADGPAVDIPRRLIVHAKTVNLTDPRRGLSPISAVRNEVSVGRQASLHTASTLANWGIPAGAWVAPKDASLTTQDQSLIRRALRSLRGPRAAGKTPILPAGLEWKALALNPKDAEWIAARKLSRMAIAAALGVPLVLAGDDEKTTVYANLRDAERIFWRGTMFPLLSWLADVLNNWLVPDFAPDGRLAVAFDTREVEAELMPLTDQVAVWTSLLDRHAVTPNEVRAHLRLGGPVPWGDQPVIQTRMTVNDPALLPETPAPPATDEVVADALRAIGPGLYRHRAVRAWITDPSTPLDVHGLVGADPSPATRSLIEAGLRRRASAAQIADSLEGTDA